VRSPAHIAGQPGMTVLLFAFSLELYSMPFAPCSMRFDWYLSPILQLRLLQSAFPAYRQAGAFEWPNFFIDDALSSGVL